MNASNLVTGLALGSILFSSAAFAEDTLTVALERNGKQAATTFKLHGKTSCMLVNDKVFCNPAAAVKQMHLASTD